jgi:hypothetical protein
VNMCAQLPKTKPAAASSSVASAREAKKPPQLVHHPASANIECPVNIHVAAQFLGVATKTLARKARDGIIPAHPVAGTKRHRYMFYLSELDAWLSSQVVSICHPCRSKKEE